MGDDPGSLRWTQGHHEASHKAKREEGESESREKKAVEAELSDAVSGFEIGRRGEELTDAGAL